MPTSLTAMDVNATIQRALSAGNTSEGLVLCNRRWRRAMRKRRKVVKGPFAVTPRLGAAPRGPAKRQRSGTSRTRRPETDPPRAGMPPTPTFTPIPSQLAFGPPTDISMGWDGTLWAIDASGAPHLYDPAQNQWNPHGDGVDAVAAVDNTLHVFRGPHYITVNLTTKTVAGGPTAIAATWPNLPDSFKLGVTGAANLDGTLYLFKGGWYLPVSAPAQRAKLTAIQGWPTTPDWVNGVIDAVVSNGQGLGQHGTVSAILTRGSEYVVVDFKNRKVISGPAPITAGLGWKGSLPADWASGGWDGAVYLQQNGTNVIYVYRGPQIASFPEFGKTVVQPKYIASIYANWPSTWNPVLNQAPSGRVGNLWSVLPSAQFMRHDGKTWNIIDGKGSSVAVGQDNSVFVVSGDNQTIDTLVAGTGWVATAKAPVPLSQVAVGDADHVFALGHDNSVHRLVKSSGAYAYNPVTLGAGVPNPTHMAATSDGTLWHCNSSNPNTFRFISEATAASAAIPVQQGSVTGVQKVAGTGFGAAHCLVKGGDGSTQVYSYDSPYVFKTSRPYVVRGNAPLAQGLGRQYFVQQVSYPMPGHVNVRFVALDAHTGQEIASYTPASNTIEYTGMVFDPINDLVYVGAAPADDYDNNSTPGQLLALDARTLQVKWTYQTKAGIDGMPALSGTQLCFGDRTGTVYMFDTRDALVNSAAPKPEWTQTITDWQGLTPPTTQRTATPVLTNGLVHAVAWGIWYPSGSNPAFAWLVVARYNAQDGGNKEFELSIPASSPAVDLAALVSYAYAPVLGTASFGGNAVPALFVAGGNAVYAVGLDQSQTNASFALPTGRIVTGFAYDDGTRAGTGLPSPSPDATRLWFGDNQGNLWALNNALQPVDHTPLNLASHTAIRTTPVLYKDPHGGLTVLFGVVQQADVPTPAATLNLYGYDPDTGNHAGVPTGVTEIWSLSQNVTNGVIYAAGGGNTTPDGQVSQVFGIRVDELPQALRDFIIESQLMQDPDPTAQGGSKDPNDPIPPSVARYQTHLTVVDDRKSPQPHEPVKIWADQPKTSITVDGQPFTIGPGDAEFASVTTGVDGSLVIVSNATDLFAGPLRIWASFMDPYERIVVNPDQEFHARVTTAHVNVGDDDPDKVNLQTAHNYNGTSLFTDQEKSQGQPQNCADAVAQMNKGVGLSDGASQATFAKVMRAITGSGSTAGVSAAAQPDKYLAYADLTGASHFPTNIPAVRPIAIAQPVGAAYWYSDPRKSDQPSTTPAFVALSAADACDAIDALTGKPWQAEQVLPSPAGGPRRVGSIFTDFWNWLKGVAADITHIIVAVADEVVVGIRLIVNGIEQVFKAVIKVIEDIAAAIGSFFQMLKKLIEDVIAALSVLFQFGEIMKTHRWMTTEIMRLVNGDPNDPINYPGFASIINDVVIPKVNQGFGKGEAALAGYLKSLEGQLQPGSHISDLQGQGSTPHTAYTVGAQGGQKSSKAVQCSWGTQKLKSGLLSGQDAPSALAGSPSAPRALDGADGQTDDLVAFLTNFLNNNNNDGLSSKFNSNFSPSPASNFFDQALQGLLEVVKTLLIDALKVANDFIDGMLKNIVVVIDLLFNETTGFITAPIDFPIIGWLYKSLFDEPLTILNLCTLVAAIPATIVYKISTGRYPSQDLPGASAAIEPTNTHAVNDAGAGADAKHPQRADLSTFQIIQVVQGFFGGVVAMALSIVRAIVDLLGPPVIKFSPWLLRLQVALGILYTASFFPLISNPDPTKTPWWGWTSWAIAVTIALTGLVSLLPLKDVLQAIVGKVMSFVRMALGIVRLVFITTGFILANPRRVSPTSGVAFGRNVALTLAPIVNPLKFLKGDVEVIVAVVDVAVGVVVLALDITLSMLILFPPSAEDHYPAIG